MRPKMPTAKHRNCKLVVYLTEAEKGALRDTAMSAGVSASLYAAQVVRRSLFDRNEDIDDNPVVRWMRSFDAGDSSAR